MKSMKKQKIAKILIVTILCLSSLMFLPWVYMTAAYYIARYVIMTMAVAALCLTFSLTNCLSIRFVRLLILTILCSALAMLFVPVVYLSDITQLAVALITVMIGAGLQWEDREWAEVSYYYTILMVIVTICNCLVYAGGLYVPEYYLFNEGKNQVGAMLAIGATGCFYFGMKRKEERTAFWVVSFLALLCTVLIRARSDCFALIACMLLITAKDADWHLKWNVKTVLTILGIALIGIIIYTGFISDELHTFMYGGKNADSLNDITSRRWTRNQRGFEILRHHQPDQATKSAIKIPFIHNYPLLRLVRYRLLSFPLIGFYIYFGISTLIEIFKTRKSQIHQVGWVVCCIPLLISFAEPNFPYGPGLVQLLAFLLLGFSLRPQNPPSDQMKTEKTNSVLHLCNDFSNSKVHSNLYRELDANGLKQTVFVPLRKSAPENNQFESEHTRLLFAHFLTRLHRLFFFHKIERTVREVEKNVNMDEFSCIHATNLFSDGMAAMELSRRHGIPYIVAVRNSDVNAFLRYMPHLWWVHRAVLANASKVVFITPTLRQRLLKHPTLTGMKKEVSEKSIIIPNGINEFWINNLLTGKNPAEPHRVLYAGNFSRNKNLPRLIQALSSLRSEFPELHLDVAGSGGNGENKALSMMKQHSDWITYHGQISDLETMKELYRANRIFAMPSKSETFGLVYVEALSQGLSVLWSKNEAIEGMFELPVGEHANPRSINDISKALRKLIGHPDNYTVLSSNTFKKFQWSAIAQQYLTLYH